MTHIHKDPPIPSGIRILKRHRIANRLVVCVIILALPTAHSLNSLHLISIVTALILWVLLLELWGISCPDDSFFGDDGKCRYTAKLKVSKKDLEGRVKEGGEGGVVKVGDLGGKGEKGFYELS